MKIVKLNCIISLVAFLLFCSCDNKSNKDQYEQTLIEYIAKSSECQFEMILIEDEIMWDDKESYRSKYDSIKANKEYVDNLYKNLVPPIEPYIEIQGHLKDIQRALNQMADNLSILDKFGAEVYERNALHESITSLNNTWGEIRIDYPDLFAKVREYNEKRNLQ